MSENVTEILVEELDPNRKIDFQLKLKPAFSIGLFIVIGILIIVLTRNLLGTCIGIFVLMFPLANIFFVKDRVIFECNDTTCIAYNVTDPTRAYQFTWDEIDTFSRESRENGIFQIEVNLKNGYTVVIPSSSEKCMSVFNHHVPEKNKITKWRKEQFAKQKARKEAKKNMKK